MSRLFRLVEDVDETEGQKRGKCLAMWHCPRRVAPTVPEETISTSEPKDRPGNVRDFLAKLKFLQELALIITTNNRRPWGKGEG